MAIKISGTTVIDDSRNVTNVGSVGDSNTVYYGDGSGLSGIQAGSSTFTASGAISNGKGVIINSDGTVSAVAESVSSTPSVSSDNAFLSESNPNFAAACYDTTNNKVIVVYWDSNDSGKGKAKVGTVSGSTVTFGSAVTWDSSSGWYNLGVAYDSEHERILITGSENNSNYYGVSIVGTVSGDSITFGTKTTFASKYTLAFVRAVYDSNAQRFAIGYGRNQVGNYGWEMIIGTIADTGNSISFGGMQQISSGPGGFSYMNMVFDSSNNKVVMLFPRVTNSNTTNANLIGRVATVSTGGNSFSMGSEVVLDSNNNNQLTGAVFDSTNNKVISTRKTGGNSVATVGTVSGTSISFGSNVTVDTDGYNQSPTMGYDAASDKVMIFYNNGSKVISGTVSGTSITFGNSTTYSDGTSGINQAANAAYDPDTGQILYPFNDSAGSIGNMVVISNKGTNATADNFIGIAAEAISNSASGSITMVTGVNASQSSLTPGQQYYVQKDGSLSTSADSPSLLAGTAISATKLIVKR